MASRFAAGLLEHLDVPADSMDQGSPWIWARQGLDLSLAGLWDSSVTPG